MTTITKNAKGIEVNVKRLCLPVSFEIPCKYCGHINEIEFDDNYLSYPTAGISETRYLYCEECDEESEDAYKVTLNMSLTVEY